MKLQLLQAFQFLRCAKYLWNPTLVAFMRGSETPAPPPLAFEPLFMVGPVQAVDFLKFPHLNKQILINNN